MLQLDRTELPTVNTGSSPHSTPIDGRSSPIPMSSPLLPRTSREDIGDVYSSPPTSPLRSESPVKETTRPPTSSPEVEASSPAALSPPAASQTMDPSTEALKNPEVLKTPVTQRFRPFVTPSRVVKGTSTSDSSSHATSSGSRRRQASSSPPSSPLRRVSPPLQFYKPPPKKQKRLAFTAPSFTSPASKSLQSSSSSTTTPETRQSQAILVTRLEGRLVLLKQARKYQKENDEVGQKGDHELMRLCEVWKEAGK